MYSDHPISRDEHDSWFDTALADPRRRYWIIERDGRPLGLVNLYAIDWDERKCFWAFYLAEPEVRGQGVGRGVESAVLRHVFEELSLDTLFCEVLAENLAVIRLHESMGFERDALLRRHVRKSDGWHDAVRLRHCRARWLSRRSLAVRAGDGSRERAPGA